MRGSYTATPGRCSGRPLCDGDNRADLSTEHWSLLGTRGTTRAEVMSRISIHLTVASAGLVVLALVAQVSDFGTAFHILSIGLTSAVLVLGTLTGIRVHNASVDDALLIMGMNRIRAAYLAIDPGLAEYFITSWHDDRAGVMQTYTMGAARHLFSHVVGSTNMFMNVVNTIVAGALGALIAGAANAGPAVIAVVGTLIALACLAVMLDTGPRSFAKPPTEPRFPTMPARGLGALFVTDPVSRRAGVGLLISLSAADLHLSPPTR